MRKITYIEFQKKHWEHRKRYKDPRHRLTQAFVIPKIDYIRRYVDINSQTSLLDVGAGNGIFTYYWADIAGLVVGVDYAEKMIKMSPCRKLLLQADATVLPFKDNSFDVVFCSNLLHHVGEPVSVVKEMKRVSKKYVILLEPNRSNFIMFPFSLIFKEERGGLKFSREYLKSLARTASLEILSCHSMGLITSNNTPTSLIGALKYFDRTFPFGAYTILIGGKE